MPPQTGQEEERGSGEDASFSFPSVATAREVPTVSVDGGGSDGGYSGWARRVIASAGEGRFGKTLRIGAWAKKPPPRPSAETRANGASPGMWPRWDPASRTASSRPQNQRLAQYRQEMMDLVRDAPESAYELSLRDLVELPRTENGREGHSGGGTAETGGKQGTTWEKEDQKKRPKKKKDPEKESWRFWRSRSERTGALVWNTAFVPVLAGLSGWKKRITETTATTAARMSPKAVVHDEGKCEAGSKDKGGDDYGWGMQRRSRSKDRWVMGKSGSGKSCSSSSSSNRSSRRKSNGCSIWL